MTKAKSAKKQRAHKTKAAAQQQDRARFDRNYHVLPNGTVLDFGLARSIKTPRDYEYSDGELQSIENKILELQALAGVPARPAQ